MLHGLEQLVRDVVQRLLVRAQGEVKTSRGQKLCCLRDFILHAEQMSVDMCRLKVRLMRTEK